MRRVVHGLAAFTVVIASVAPGCLDATEIQIDIQTDSCASLKTVEVYVGGGDGSLAAAPSAVATSCGDAAANDVGSVTLVPSSGIGDEISVAFVGTLFGGSCTPASASDPSCIIAHRDIRFVPHGKQKLTVRLDGACAGVQCPAGETCEVESGQGVCRSSCQLGCADDGGVVDAGGPDGGVSGDATGSTCIAPPPLPSTNATWVWSFPYPQNGSLEDDNHTPSLSQPFIVGAAVVPGDSTSPCSSYLQVGTGVQRLASDQPPLNTSTHLAITAHYRAIQASAAIIALEGSSGALRTSFNASGNLAVVTIIQATSTSLVDSSPSADGQWHFLYVDVDTLNNTLKAWRDGNPVGNGTTSLPTGYTNAGPLVAGASVDIDQVQLFSK